MTDQLLLFDVPSNAWRLTGHEKRIGLAGVRASREQLGDAMKRVHTATLVNACGDEKFEAFEQNEYMVRSNVFAQMLRLGKDVVRYHFGDFYSDAMWLRKHLHGEWEFFWACRDTGTSIGTDEMLVGYSNEHLYHVRVQNDRGRWTATFTEREVLP